MLTVGRYGGGDGSDMSVDVGPRCGVAPRLELDYPAQYIQPSVLQLLHLHGDFEASERHPLLLLFDDICQLLGVLRQDSNLETLYRYD